MAVNFNIPAAQAHLSRVLRDKMTVVGELVASNAALLSPLDTGNLRGSIEYRVVSDPEKVSVRISDSAEYAAWVELGTGIYSKEPGSRKDQWVFFMVHPKGTARDRSGNKGFWVTTSGMKPRPFLLPALLQNKNNIQRILAI